MTAKLLSNIVLVTLFNELFEARQEGDYVDFVQYDEALIAPWIPAVKKFIDRLAQLALEAADA